MSTVGIKKYEMHLYWDRKLEKTIINKISEILLQNYHNESSMLYRL